MKKITQDIKQFKEEYKHFINGPRMEKHHLHGATSICAKEAFRIITHLQELAIDKDKALLLLQGLEMCIESSTAKREQRIKELEDELSELRKSKFKELTNIKTDNESNKAIYEI